MKGNILVKAGAVFLIVIVTLIALKKCGGDEYPVSEEDALPMGGGEPIPEETLGAIGLEGDTKEDTVRTLVSEVRKMRQDMHSLRQENAELREDNSALINMEESIRQRVKADIADNIREVGTRAQRQYESLSTENENRIDQLMSRFNKNAGAPGSAGQSYYDGQGTVWINSIDSPPVTENGFSLPLLGGKGGQSRSQPTDRDRFGTDNLPGVKGRRRGKASLEPVYTIPKNATLVGSTSLTALVGRVPVGGNVVDPYSFKLIIGKDNLTANGIELPEVAHAVASGKAVGDWTLGCVRGELNSITFIFQDGTIRTVPKPKDITEGGQATKGLPIGELSDKFGNPCVLGQRITNAYSYLAQRVGVTAAGAAAEAAAAAETTTETSVDGGGIGVVTTVDGSKGEYVLNRTLSGGAQEVADWLDERQSNEFDAIYVPPGQSVAIHITEELWIDYDSEGRKTQYSGLAFGGQSRELD